MSNGFLYSNNVSRLRQEVKKATMFKAMYEKQGLKDDAARQQKYIDRANANLLAEIARRD